MDGHGHLVWTHFANKYYAALLTIVGFLFYMISCVLSSHTQFFNLFVNRLLGLKNEEEDEGPNSHSQMFVHSHTLASSIYMILSTQHRVHKPENLHQQYMSLQRKEIYQGTLLCGLWIYEWDTAFLGACWAISLVAWNFFGFQKFLFLTSFVFSSPFLASVNIMLIPLPLSAGHGKCEPFFLVVFLLPNYEYHNETKALVQAFSSTTNKGGGSSRTHQPLFSFLFLPL